MFGKFLQTPECMRVLAWLLNHPDDTYSAAIIAIECNMVDMSSFMAVLSILEGAQLIKLDEFSSDELMIGLDSNSSAGQLLAHFQEEFNECAFASEQVSPSLAYLHSPQLKKTIDSQILERFEKDDLIDMCKNYKDLSQENDFEKEIYNICSKLDETGEYEEFIQRLENDINEK